MTGMHDIGTAIRRRVTAGAVAGREAAIAAAFRLDQGSVRGGGVWRWDLSRDRLWFGARATRLIADLGAKVSSHPPVFLSYMPVRDRRAVLLALYDVLQTGASMDCVVELGLGEGRRRVRLHARPAPADRQSLVGTLEAL